MDLQSIDDDKVMFRAMVLIGLYKNAGNPICLAESLLNNVLKIEEERGL